MPRERNRYRERRSYSHSSESSHDRKKSRSKHKRRSRSGERSVSSHKKRRSVSRSKHRRRSHSRSVSRDRYESRSRRRSHSRSKRSKQSTSKGRSHSRSSSRSRDKKRSSKNSTKRSKSSSSRSNNSFDIEPAHPNKKINLDDTETKIEKAIKAAEAAGLTMTKIPTYEYKDVEIKEDMPTIHDRNLLTELNSDSFVQKSFTSSRSKKQNIVIDLNTQTVTVPETQAKKDDSIIDFDALPSEEEMKEMWIKKVYQFRKRMLKGEI